MKRNVFRMALCMLLVLVIGAAPMTALAAKNSKVVAILKCNVDGGRLREGPSSAYDVVTSLKKGEMVFYNNQKDGAFCYVRTLYGQTGYIYHGFLELYGAARADQVYYANDKSIRVYRRPSTSASKATTLGAGEHVIVYKTVGEWAFVKTLRGKSGFVKTSGLTQV